MIKDYYEVLGVLPSAEDVVIRAAYRALAQRYHPDRAMSSEDEATKRMAEINEAYAILSDQKSRKSYDDLRKSAQGDFGEFTNASGSEAAFDSGLHGALQSDWSLATKYFPDLADITSNLEKIAYRLASTYQAYMLETKLFPQRREIAAAMEITFLESYFGKNKEILKFAKKLIFLGRRDALRALNEAVRVLGGAVDQKFIVNKILVDFDMAESPKPAASSPKPTASNAPSRSPTHDKTWKNATIQDCFNKLFQMGYKPESIGDCFVVIAPGGNVLKFFNRVALSEFIENNFGKF